MNNSGTFNSYLIWRRFTKKILYYAILAISVAALYALFVGEHRALAAGSQEVYGWTWSENIGWISFNSKNCDTDGNGFSDSSPPAPSGCPSAGTAIAAYKVSVDMGSGNFSGYAWSENIGWIKLDPTTTPPGEASAKPVRLNIDGTAPACGGINDVCGWARVCSEVADKANCEGALLDSGAGGWDGWIHFRNGGASPYGLTWDPVSGEFKGWAWSDMVLGWMSANSKNCDTDGDGFSDIGAPAGCPVAGTPMAAYKIYMAPQTYTISGNVFNDVNKNNIKDSAETNYTGPVAITITPNLGVVTVNADRSYSITGLPGGTYTISADFSPGLLPGYQIEAPKPASFVVTVGTGCSVTNPVTGGKCVGLNIIDLNFALSNLWPWFQTYGLDVRFDYGISDQMPSHTACGSGSYASGTTSQFTTPGIVFSGDASPDFGQGSASINNWVAGGTSYPEVFRSTARLKTSTQNILAAAAKAGITPQPLESWGPCSSPATSCNLNGLGKGLWYAKKSVSNPNGDIVIDHLANFNTGNYVIVADGTITITGNNTTLSVPLGSGSTALFAAGVDIKIDQTIQNNTNSCPGASVQLEGIFSADRSIVVEGNNGDCGLGPDKRFDIGGTLIVNAARLGGSFVTQRDLCGENPKPAMTVSARPDFLLNLPGFLSQQTNISHEEVP